MGHGHDHHPVPGGDSIGSRRFALAVGLNVAFVAVEATYGVLSGSLALLADAGHNLGDVFSLVLAWVALLLARRAPSLRRTYGLRRGTILASLVSATLLLVAIGMIAWEAVGRLGTPSDVPPRIIMIVAGIGVLLNTATALLFVRHQNDLNVRAAYVHMAADAAISLGVVIGGGLLLWTGWSWIDPLVSLLICLVIAVGTLGVFRESFGLAMDGVPRDIDAEAVRTFLNEREGVEDVHDLHIWAMSTTENALTAHLVVPGGIFGDRRLHETAEDLQRRFGIHHATLQVETGEDTRVCHATHDRL